MAPHRVAADSSAGGVFHLVSRMVGARRLSSWHCAEALRQYQRLDAARSIRHFYKSLEIFPEDWRTWHHLSIVYSQLLGDLDESLRLLRYARRLRERLLAPGGKIPPYRFLDYRWVAHIGHIANMEHLIKREILLGRDPKRLILHLPAPQQPANRALLEKMGAYVSIVTEEEALPYPVDSMLSVLEEYYLCESIDGMTKHWWHASSEILRAWEEAGREPLLTHSAAEMQQGRAGLRALGVPEGAWFACLHVRESGFKREHGYNAVEAVLNADVDTYLSAIRAVTDRGGWVVRMGDPKMQPLPPMLRTADYAHSGLRSDWMDVFLLGNCRFLIGTSSGPAYIPPLFGIPCVLTNWAPTGQRPFNLRDLYIPKRFRADVPPRELGFAEMMAPPLGYAPRYALADALCLESIPNTAEEIREVVIEMLDRTEGTLTYSREDEVLRSAFEAVADTNISLGNARLGRAFLQRYRHLLLSAAQRAA
jgi:putative glycosyltransferase (TIGR04372 family)